MPAVLGWTAHQVALPLPLADSYDYLLPDQTPPGSIVSVRFGRQHHHGVVLAPAVAAAASYQVRPVETLWGDPWILPRSLLDLGRQVARYYQAPLGMVLSQMLPPRILGALADVAVNRCWRLTEAGRVALADLPVRAHAKRKLAGRLHETPAPTQALRALGPGAMSLLRAWRAAGWVEALVDVSPAAPDTLELTGAQAQALAEISATPLAQPALLHGITGSGKTELYLALALELAGRGRQTLLLVPEINLTPQLEARIRERAPSLRLAVLHSGLAAGARARSWAAAARGEPDLLLGTRLAVFAPAPRLGAIILDEEQDASYKQAEGVRYHAREVALFRARLEGIRVLLGSATPSLETWARAAAGRYSRVVLPERAMPGAVLPKVSLLPPPLPGGGPVGEELLAAVKTRLAQGEQSLLFVNRRGYAPVLLCLSCGWEAPCPHCAARLVVHLAAASACCHHCGFQRLIPRACPQCGNLDLLPRGFGTQRLEEDLAQRLPGARRLRIDRDSTRQRHAWLDMLAQIRRGEVDVLIGTQMLAKGHDFPNVTLAGVLGADNAFFSADFRATERLFAQLLQVGGRAGRAGKQGEVLIQTAFAHHPLLRAVLSHDYQGGAEILLAERRAAALPPFTHLALLHAEAPRRDAVEQFLARAHALATQIALAPSGELEVFSPVPSALSRRAGIERGQLLIQAASRRALAPYLESWRLALHGEPGRVRWFIDVDPIDLS
ncbi:Primosomal protein N' [Burkholderiales bacterium]|nr:Primosomal protein N' [Burkholderiales bacterium]